jgi:putative transposase
MRKTAKKGSRSEEETTSPTLADVIRRDLREFVIDAGLLALEEMLERERTVVCGPRYAHQEERRAHRGGHTVGELVMGGRRVRVRRPRARGMNGREVVLPSWTAYAAEDPLHERALAQMLLGVSTRRYEGSLEGVPAGVVARGTSKSAVSRRFVAATEAQMRVWLGRDLGDIDLAVLMIDGVYVDEHVLLVAVGIDCQGRKHVLGVREGATENSTACKALLADLQERSLPTGKTILAVLDGSKALAKAVRDVFGGRALVQRCQVHKMRNILDQLPEDMRPSVREALRQAYRSGNAERAKKLLVNLARRLRADHPSAAASIDEGLDETLTVMRFGLPSSLARVLSTTNVIENIIGSVRNVGGRVKRWKNAQMILRWTTAAVSAAATRFRSIAGHKSMPVLVRILRDRDHSTSSVEPRGKAA